MTAVLEPTVETAEATTKGLTIDGAYERIAANLAEIAQLRAFIARTITERESELIAATDETVSMPNGLTEREAQVSRYLATPLTVSEIARELYVSTNTVKTHMKNIYSKLGASRRAEAVMMLKAVAR